MADNEKVRAVNDVICNRDPKEPDRMICRYYRVGRKYPIAIGHVRKVVAKDVDVRVLDLSSRGSRTIIRPQHGKGLLTIEIDEEHKFLTVKGAD